MAKIENAAIGELDGIPSLPKKRGRPATGKALTNAERQARFQRDKRLAVESAVDVLRSASDEGLAVMIADFAYPDMAKLAFLALGRRRGWL